MAKKKVAKKAAKKAASRATKSSPRNRDEDRAVAAAASESSEVDEFSMSRFSSAEYSPEYNSEAAGDNYSSYSEEEKGFSRLGLVAAVVAVVVALAAIYYAFPRGDANPEAGGPADVPALTDSAAKPPAPEAEKKPEVAAPAPEKKPEAEAAPAPEKQPEAAAGGNTYTVKVGDQLFRIAENQLGNGNRYKEIIELNKALLPKGAMSLQPGMTLKMPPK